MRKISQFLHLIITSSPAKVDVFLKKFGMRPATDISDAMAKMKVAINKYGDDAMFALAAIHPDKELIVAAYEDAMKKGKKSLGACGCIGADSTISAEATVVTDTTDPNKDFLSKEITVSKALIYGALGLIALTLFVKVVKS